MPWCRTLVTHFMNVRLFCHKDCPVLYIKLFNFWVFSLRNICRKMLLQQDFCCHTLLLKKLQPCPPDLLLDHCLLFFARILKAHQGVILLLWSAWGLLGLEIAWVEIRMHFRNGIFTLHLIRYLRMFYVYQWKKLSQGLVYFFSTYGNITFTA